MAKDYGGSVSLRADLAGRVMQGIVTSIDSEENYQRLRDIAASEGLKVSQWVARDACKQADALIATLGVSDWKWIHITEDMPPSGKPVLVAVRNVYGEGSRSVVIRATWADQYTLEAWDEDCDDILEYREEDDTYYVPEGWYEDNAYEETHWRVGGEVTHWTNLPGLPEYQDD